MTHLERMILRILREKRRVGVAQLKQRPSRKP